MTEEEREFLERVCAELEDGFPGVSAGFEGFLTPMLGGEYDGCLTIEVFNVAKGDIESVLSAGEALVGDRLVGDGAFVAFSPWTTEQTKEYFQKDVEASGLLCLDKGTAAPGDTLELVGDGDTGSPGPVTDMRVAGPRYLRILAHAKWHPPVGATG